MMPWFVIAAKYDYNSRLNYDCKSRTTYISFNVHAMKTMKTTKKRFLHCEV